MNTGIYTEEYLINKLKWLKNKNGHLSTSDIDREPNFPTRKCFIRQFGSLENAFKKVNYNDYKKHSFNIDDAQNELNIRNPNFTLLTFNGMRNKNLTRCKTCGYEWEVSTDSLLRSKSETHGCPKCYKQNGHKRILRNDLTILKDTAKIKKVKCLKCGFEFYGFTSNLSDIKFKCQRCSAVDRKFYKLHKLLDESLQSYYILGLLMADGHFSNNGRISISLKYSDWKILFDIKNYLDIKNSLHYFINNNHPNIGLSVMDCDTCEKLRKRYSIESNKTVNPCNLQSLAGNDLTAFIIGFIDGDGNFGVRSDTKAKRYTIKLHKNWEVNLNKMAEHLYQSVGIKEFPHAIYVHQPQGIYSSITIGNQKVIQYLNNFIISNNIFVLKRKWDLCEKYNNKEAV